MSLGGGRNDDVIRVLAIVDSSCAGLTRASAGSSPAMTTGRGRTRVSLARLVQELFHPVPAHLRINGGYLKIGTVPSRVDFCFALDSGAKVGDAERSGLCQGPTWLVRSQHACSSSGLRQHSRKTGWRRTAAHDSEHHFFEASYVRVSLRSRTPKLLAGISTTSARTCTQLLVAQIGER